jgi:threonine synthase
VKNVLHITATLGLSALLSLLGVEVAGATTGDTGRQVTALTVQDAPPTDIDWP